jgi:RNA polymerase sigma factor (sigma-70 family)
MIGFICPRRRSPSSADLRGCVSTAFDRPSPEAFECGRIARAGSRATLVDSTEPSPRSSSPALGGADDLRSVRGALAGHPADVETLVVRLRSVPRLLAALNARLGWHLDEAELADVAQETVVLVWRKLASFDASSSLETWFYGIARFELLNAIRRKQRRDAGRVELEQVPASMSERADLSEQQSVQGALERLPPDEAQVLKLYYYDDLSLAEVARRVDAAVGTVKSRYYRALDHLRALLRDRTKGERG